MNEYISEKDWKVLRKKMPKWQEDYIQKMNEKYAKILASGEQSSTIFWQLYDEINEDINHVGVRVQMSRSRAFDNILELLWDEAITINDLDEFTDEFREGIVYAYNISQEKPKCVKLKVSSSDCPSRFYRVLLADTSLSLKELGFLILTAFNAAFEHMYYFKDQERVYEDKTWLENSIFGNELDYSEYTIDDVILDKNNSFTLEYDTGEGWLFNIQVLEETTVEKCDSPMFCLKGAGDRIWEDMRHDFLEYIHTGKTENGVIPWNASEDYKLTDFDNELNLDEINEMLEIGLDELSEMSHF